MASFASPASLSRGGISGSLEGSSSLATADLLTPEHSAREIDSIVRRAIGDVLGDSQYSVEMADLWCDQIMERTLKQIASIGWPFKYIATCVISRQTGGVVLDTAATAFWDTQSDSLCCTRRGNGMVDCIVTVYACRR
mmetsp:Transcript_27167/g.61649  ORF Transcript_27167/g.61649 Transcript_27167/m.61649 type:complete len:138 (-) Transcript_27167:138-551(-)